MKSFASTILLFALAVKADDGYCADLCEAENLSDLCIQNCKAASNPTNSQTKETGDKLNADDAKPLTSDDVEDINNIQTLAAEADDRKLENSVATSKCISIESTSACAPWSSGLKVDVMELSRVYGREIKTAKDWEDALIDATNGGELMTTQWRDFASCPRYSGEPIQFARTYSCLTDIFFFSAPCENKVTKVFVSLY
jgi:hypothetical protein